MIEFLPAVLGAGLLIGLAVPLFTLLAKGVLVWRRRVDPDPRRHGSLPTFLLLVAPSLGAVLWFISASLHVSEPGGAAEGCLNAHVDARDCVDALLFASFLIALLLAAFTRGWWWHESASQSSGQRLAPSTRQVMRLSRLCARHPRLFGLARRVIAVRGEVHPLCTRGLFRPKIEVSTELLEKLDDQALIAALLHEAEHLRAFDPLRYLVASASIALNPCGFLLREELRRWRAAREAVCDEWAVRRSADPLALASALVTSARQKGNLRPFAVALGGASSGLLRLRVHLLLDYVSRPPSPPSHSPLWLGVGVSTAVLVLPHILGAWPFEIAHVAIEQALFDLGLI